MQLHYSILLSVILMCVCGPGAVAQDAATTGRWTSLPEARALPSLAKQGFVERDGARIWYGTVGKGAPVVLLHGGLSSSDDWGNQVPALIESHHRIILIDSRGHGRSTRSAQPLHYEVMEGDVIAVMDELHIGRAQVVGWSDGAIIGLVLAMK